VRYQMQKRILSFRGQYDIRAADGSIAWIARVRILAWRTTIDIMTASGEPAARLRRRVLSFPGTWDLTRTNGPSAEIRRAFRLTRGAMTVTEDSGHVLTAEGDFLKREYTVESTGDVIALVSKRFFSLRDRYGIEFTRDGETPQADDIPVIAIALVVDRAHHEHRS